MADSTRTSILRFNFELDAIDDIAPWGEGDDRKLHWFGLTSGRYWISTPLGEALRYTDEQVREWGGQSPYVDYQIARIFEDLQCVLPSSLEPVPPEIAALVADGGWADSIEWRLKSLDDTDERTDLYDTFWDATDWYSQRSIDTAYLVDGPNFYFWRIKDEVHFRWRIHGESAIGRWCLPQGQFTVTAEQFESAVYSFFEEVLLKTQERVARIATTGWHRTDCKLDVPQLVSEQRQRTDWIGALRKRRSKTDWDAVRKLVNKISAELSIPTPVEH